MPQNKHFNTQFGVSEALTVSISQLVPALANPAPVSLRVPLQASKRCFAHCICGLKAHARAFLAEPSPPPAPPDSLLPL